MLQSIDTYMTCVIEFNITITYMMIFQNKYTHIITSVTYYTADMLALIYSNISQKQE